MKKLIIAIIVLSIIVFVVYKVRTAKAKQVKIITAEKQAIIDIIMLDSIGLPNFYMNDSVLIDMTLEELQKLSTQVKEDAFDYANS